MPEKKREALVLAEIEQLSRSPPSWRSPKRPSARGSTTPAEKPIPGLPRRLRERLGHERTCQRIPFSYTSGDGAGQVVELFVDEGG
jgi:hypothetical protein